MSHVANLKGASALGFSRVKAPVGFMLAHAIHDSYGTVFECILEIVQNAIDAHAQQIAVQIDKKKRTIEIFDDGDGVSKEKYEAALQSVMKSTKTRDKYGQFGRGMLSPLKKCEWHTLVSCPKGGMIFYEWHFETKAIEEQSDDIYVPHKVRSDIRLKTDPRGAQAGVKLVEWQTAVQIHRYIDDRAVARIPSADEIFDELMRRYREKMLENNIRTVITILNEKGVKDEVVRFAVPYRGHRLPKHTVHHIDAGTTTFNLYLARKNAKGQYEGASVSLGEADNPSRVPFRTLTRSVDGVLSHEIVEALKSGVFEGDIITERARMHHDRKRFEPSNALLGFYETIEQWYEEVGKTHYKSVLEARDTERYKALGEDLSKTIESMLNDQKFADLLRPVTSGLKQERARRDAEGEKRDVSLGSVPHTPVASVGTGATGGVTKPLVPSVVPTSPNGGVENVDGAKHKRRARIENNTVGIEFRYEEIYDANVLWTFAHGVLTFNILHARWRACEGTPRKLKQLQEFICVKALTLELMPPEWRAEASAFSDELDGPIVHLLLHSPNFQHHLARKHE